MVGNLSFRPISETSIILIEFLTPSFTYHTTGIAEMDVAGASECDLTPYPERSFQSPTSDPLPNSFQSRPSQRFHSHPPSRATSPAIHQPPSLDEDTPGSPNGRVSMSSTSTVSPQNISIKAYVTEDTIVVFRASLETKYAEIRDKIYDKFVNQESISLAPDFSIAYLVPTQRRSTSSSVYAGTNKHRSGSVGNTSAHESSLVHIQSQEKWEEILRESDGKLTLRVVE